MQKISPLRAKRVLQGATLHDISKKSRIELTRLSLIERGHKPIKPEEVPRLAKALNCDPWEIFLPPEVQ